MKLRQLVLFEAVARHRNITRASRALAMSQPALSLQIKALESECQAKFLVRSKAGIELTSQGAEFLNDIRPILSKMESLMAEREGLSERVSRSPSGAGKADEGKASNPVRATKFSRLRVGGSNTLSVTVLPEIASRMQSMHPGVEIELSSRSSDWIEDSVARGDVDIGLGAGELRNPLCLREPFIRHKATAFVPQGHPMADRTVSLEVLCSQPLIAKKGSACIREIRKRGCELNLVMQCDAPEAVKASVIRGGGVGILFRSRIEQALMAQEVRPVHVPELDEIFTQSFILTPLYRPLSEETRIFLGLLRHYSKRRSRMADMLV